MIRVAPVLAIAWRDLRAELAGARGLGLPIVAAVLLVPASLLRAPEATEVRIPVRGDVPDVVRELPSVSVGRAGTGFRTVQGVTVVYGYEIPEPIREALDRGQPSVRVEALGEPMRIPRRSLFFALVSASTLTGAVSGSIGGERARNTLQALLSAAVTRLEIVLGKWLAWTGFGAVAAVLAGLAAVVAGTQPAGPWLLALPLVPGLLVALGLWLVRRTEDVIAGTSVTLRVLPAVLAGLGLAAWIASGVHPLLGAAVPLGGALLAAGDLWDGAWAPTLVALASSVLATGLLLAGTARDLEQDVASDPSHRVRPIHAVPDGLMALATWWTLVPGPVLWGWAGNPAHTASLTVERGLTAGAGMLGALAVVRWLRLLDPAAIPRLGRPGWRGLAAGVGLAACVWLPSPAVAHPWLAAAADRMHAGLVPPPWLVLPVVLAQEVWFRGLMHTRAGAVATALAWTAAVAPFDPLAGLLGGALLGWAAQEGLSSAIVARLVGWAGAVALAS